MNAFALHDVIRPGRRPALGHLGDRDRRRACRADRAGDGLVHAAADARRDDARHHGRHGAGDVVAGADADGHRAGTRDAAGRRLAARARDSRRRCRSRSRRPRRRRSPRSRRRRNRRQQPTPPKPEPAKIVPEPKPVPVKPKAVRAGGQEADGGAAGAAHQRAAARRAAGAGRVGDQRRRRGRRDGRPTISCVARASAALQAISAGGEGRGPAGRRAAELHAQPQRPGAGQPARRLVGPSRRSMRRPWRWSAAPSRFRRSRPRSIQASMRFNVPVSSSRARPLNVRAAFSMAMRSYALIDQSREEAGIDDELAPFRVERRGRLGGDRLVARFVPAS